VGQRDIEKMAAEAILYSRSADASAAAAVLGAADAGGYMCARRRPKEIGFNIRAAAVPRYIRV